MPSIFLFQIQKLVVGVEICFGLVKFPKYFEVAHYFAVEGPLMHPQQTQFLLNRAQNRIFDRRYDKRPPLVHLYDMLRRLPF